MKKILSLVTVVCLLLSCSTTVFAGYSTEVEYVGTGVSEWELNVPIKMAPGETAEVTLEGTWDIFTTINVDADDTVTLDDSVYNDTEVLDIEFAGITQVGDNDSEILVTKDISVADMPEKLFGEWKGIFNYYLTIDFDGVEGAAVVDGVGYDTLQEAVNAVKDGGTVVLLDDVTVNDGDDAIAYRGASSFTLDLNGKTFTANTTNAALKINTNNDNVNVPVTVNIKNGTITAGPSAYLALVVTGKEGNPLTVNTENVVFNGSHHNGSVVRVCSNSILNLNNGTIINANNSYEAVQCLGGALNVNDGVEIYYTGESNVPSSNKVLIGVAANGVANIYGGKGVSEQNALSIYNSGGTLNVYDGVWSANNRVLDSNDDYNDGNSLNLNVFGGKFDGGFHRSGPNSKIEISGGSFSDDPTSYVADGYTVTNTGNGDYPFVVK